MPTVLITGANRGIGLEFATRYAQDGWRVVAACRDPDGAADLARLPGAVEVRRVDVADDASVRALADALKDEPLDLLVNNAGIGGKEGGEFGAIDYRAFARVIEVNTFGPIRMAEAFAEHLARGSGKRHAVITSRMGSIGAATGGRIQYRTSKAALNMAMATAARDLAARGIVTVLLHPGWVRTRMGGDGAAVSPGDSVAGMRAIIDRLKADDNGRFYNYDGAELPW